MQTVWLQTISSMRVTHSVTALAAGVIAASFTHFATLSGSGFTDSEPATDPPLQFPVITSTTVASVVPVATVAVLQVAVAYIASTCELGPTNCNVIGDGVNREDTDDALNSSPIIDDNVKAETFNARSATTESSANAGKATKSHWFPFADALTETFAEIGGVLS
jgi:hypothetical protein